MRRRLSWAASVAGLMACFSGLRRPAACSSLAKLRAARLPRATPPLVGRLGSAGLTACYSAWRGHSLHLCLGRPELTRGGGVLGAVQMVGWKITSAS